MTDGEEPDYRPYLNYRHHLPYLAVELADGARPDLAEQARNADDLTSAMLVEIIRVGLDEGSSVALSLATQLRTAQLVIDIKELRASDALVTDLVRLVEAHWEVARFKRSYLNFEAREAYEHFADLVLGLAKSNPGVFAFVARLMEFEDLAKIAWDSYLFRYAAELGTYTSVGMDRLLAELPDVLEGAFDDLYRGPLTASFEAEYGADAIEQLNEREELWTGWDRALVPVARDFLIGVYSGELRADATPSGIHRYMETLRDVPSTGRANDQPMTSHLIDEGAMKSILGEVARSGGDQRLLDAVELQIHRSNQRVRNTSS